MLLKIKQWNNKLDEKWREKMGLNESVEWGILYRNLQYTKDFCCEKAVAGSRALSNAHSSAYPAPFSSLLVCITFHFHSEVNNRRKTAEKNHWIYT